jgi:hypothetical protein
MLRIERHSGHSTDLIPVSLMFFRDISTIRPEKTHLVVVPELTAVPTGSRPAARSNFLVDLVFGGESDRLGDRKSREFQRHITSKIAIAA